MSYHSSCYIYLSQVVAVRGTLFTHLHMFVLLIVVRVDDASLLCVMIDGAYIEFCVLIPLPVRIGVSFSPWSPCVTLVIVYADFDDDG